MMKTKKPHYVFKSLAWWRFQSPQHLKDFKEFCADLGGYPDAGDPIRMQSGGHYKFKLYK